MRRSVVPLLVVLGLVLAACGPAAMPAKAPETASGEQFVIGLPPLTVTFDETGKPGVEGVPIEAIAQSLGVPIQLPAINPYYVEWMKNANIQHVELRQTGDGLALLVNGKLLPYLSYKDGSLEAAGELARMFGGPQGAQVADMIAKVAPIAKRLGLSVVLKFPTADGAAEIPLATDEVVMAPPATPDGPPSAVMQFEVKYDENGVPSIMGISAQDLAALGINAPMALDPLYIQLAQANNFQNMQLSSRPDGLHLYVNGVELPSIAWDSKMLTNAVDVYGQMNPGIPGNYLDVIKQLIPLLGKTDASVLVHLPVAPGAEVIPAKIQ
jgi:hypothetical protein